MQIQPRFNDWFVNRDTDDLGAAVGPFVAGFDHVAGIGFSMGGYGALRLSAALNLAAGGGDFAASVDRTARGAV